MASDDQVDVRSLPRQNTVFGHSEVGKSENEVVGTLQGAGNLVADQHGVVDESLGDAPRIENAAGGEAEHRDSGSGLSKGGVGLQFAREIFITPVENEVGAQELERKIDHAEQGIQMVRSGEPI